MHGLGNDYLYYFGDLKDAPNLSIKYADRHFGIGSDGIITIDYSSTCDFKMRVFNADGSEAKMCGNGIRCVGKYVYDKGYTTKTSLTVETLSGVKYLTLKVKDGEVESVTVDMGKGEVYPSVTLSTPYGEVNTTPVSMGNPHTVTFVEDGENAPLTTVGKALEKHEFFDGGVNAEFVQVIDKNTIRMRVWERGSGITMACGTGACASVCACINAGYCNKNEDITVKLDGGDLNIKVLDDFTVLMTGPATKVCECEV